MAIVAIAIRTQMGSPVLFRQQRPGLDGRPFTLVKFRTMHDDEPAADGEFRDSRRRVTKLGSVLRKTSLDELPELWNVLRGEMSIVGPRPLLMEYLDYYSEEQARRHDVLPGMTGWAQVHGRREVQMQDRLAMDVWYVDHWSLRLDAWIMRATIGQIVRGHNAEPTRTMSVADLGWEKADHDPPDDDRPKATR
jgi:lipopolysaccharide/colanic/teichoic acid biosynthesis glycosyltransferase